jgi:hypothetical protein
MVAVGEARADPRRCDAHTDPDRRVNHAEDGLLPSVVGTQGSDDHDNGGGDSRRDRLVGSAYQRHGEGSDADQLSHAPRLEREDQQVSKAQDKTYRCCGHTR